MIRRRRECEDCQKRFTTYERIEEHLPLVVKKDDRRETFDREKLLSGIWKACQKRPISMEQVEKAATEIEQYFQELGEREIPADRIGEQVMNKLLDLDKVAYVRFASVYRDFQDVEEFSSEVKELLAKQKK